MTTISPEQLERFRQLGLRLDAKGQLWHDALPIAHPRLHKALLSWLDVLPDGRDIVRLDTSRYAYVEVMDAHLIVLALVWSADRAWLYLNDGSEEELAYDTVHIGNDNAACCRVKSRRLRARFSSPAHNALARRIEELSATPGSEPSASYGLRAAGQLFPLEQRSG